MKKLLLVALFTVFSTSSYALDSRVINFLIGVCHDHEGRDVDFVFHQDIDSYAYATIHRDGANRNQYIPVIHVNTNFFRGINVQTQAFVLAHECGHHALGHVATPGGSEPISEFAADCWAVNLLIRHNIISTPEDLLAIEKDFYKMGGGRPRPRSETHPGTLERFDNAHSCMRRNLF